MIAGMAARRGAKQKKAGGALGAHRPRRSQQKFQSTSSQQPLAILTALEVFSFEPSALTVG